MSVENGRLLADIGAAVAAEVSSGVVRFGPDWMGELDEELELGSGIGIEFSTRETAVGIIDTAAVSLSLADSVGFGAVLVRAASCAGDVLVTCHAGQYLWFSVSQPVSTVGLRQKLERVEWAVGEALEPLDSSSFRCRRMGITDAPKEPTAATENEWQTRPTLAIHLSPNEALDLARTFLVGGFSEAGSRISWGWGHHRIPVEIVIGSSR